MKTALTIAGSDPTGGAGLQADLKTFSANGVYGMSVIASVVAENTCRVWTAHSIPPDMIALQIEAVMTDIFPNAVKIGMLDTPAAMEAVAEGLRRYAPPHVVLDPVMVAKNGSPLMQPGAMAYLIRTLFPLAEVVTPNIPEAEAITGLSIHSTDDMERAARQILDLGCKAVVVKGGHAQGQAVDVLYDGQTIHRYSAERIPTRNTHGTGCTFSSAIASRLALGDDIADAVDHAKAYVTGAIAHALPLGHGCGPTNHFFAWQDAGEAVQRHDP